MQLQDINAVNSWLAELGMEHYQEVFASNHWYAQNLYELSLKTLVNTIADEEHVDIIYSELRLYKAAIKQSKQVIAETRSELEQAGELCRQLGAEWNHQPILNDIYQYWPGPIAHEIKMLGELLH